MRIVELTKQLLLFSFFFFKFICTSYWSQYIWHKSESAHLVNAKLRTLIVMEPPGKTTWNIWRGLSWHRMNLNNYLYFSHEYCSVLSFVAKLLLDVVTSVSYKIWIFSFLNVQTPLLPDSWLYKFQQELSIHSKIKTVFTPYVGSRIR